MKKERSVVLTYDEIEALRAVSNFSPKLGRLGFNRTHLRDIRLPSLGLVIFTVVILALLNILRHF